MPDIGEALKFAAALAGCLAVILIAAAFAVGALLF
jgi:hypothetical protein